MEITPEQLEDAVKALGITLYDWQKRLIWDREVKKWCINAGRKSGKTQAIILRSAVRLLNDDIKGSSLFGGILVVSNGQEQAKQILFGILDVLAVLGWTFSHKKFMLDMDKKIAYMSAKEIKMPNGNRVLALPTGMDGHGLRPYSMHEVIKDECDYLTEEVHIAMSACTAKYQGTEILESTPNMKADIESYFAKAFFGKNPGYTCIHIKTEDVLHVPKEWLAEQKLKMSKAEYEREFEGAFSATAAAVFPKELVYSCIDRGKVDWDALDKSCATKYIGVDFARMGECKNVIATNYFDPSTQTSYIKIKVIEGEGVKLTQVEGEIGALLTKDARILRCVTDESAIGAAVTDALAERFGQRIVGVINWHRVHETEGTRGRYLKEDMYAQLMRAMEKGGIVFQHDMRIAASLLSMRYEYKRTGVLTIWGRDADIAEAVVRAFMPVWCEKHWFGDVKTSVRIIQ